MSLNMFVSAMENASDTQFQYFFFSICVIFAVGIVSFIKKLHRNSITPTPPGPFALPVIGHLHLLTSTLHVCFKNLASKYGPLMLIHSGANTLYVVSNGAVANQVFRTHDIEFAARPDAAEAFPDSFYKETALPSIDYGKYYIFVKKICMREALSNQQVARFADIRREAMVDLLRNLVMKSEQGDGCDLGLKFHAMVNKLIVRMTMSIREDETSEMLRAVAKKILDGGGLFAWEEAFPFLIKYDLFGAGKKMTALWLRFDALMDGIISKREMENRAGGNGDKDMLDTLLSISEDETSEVKLTKDGIKGLLKDFIVGGTHSTWIALQWAMAELLNHPNALKKLQDEIDQVVGLNRIVEESDIPNLPYLQAIIKETLRLHPVFTLVFRRCREDCEINGFPIAKNSTVVLNLYAINRDPNAWENADAFVPERFLTGGQDDDDPNGIKLRQNFSYWPFGGGRRACPGTDLATSVLQIAIAAMVQCFDWKIKGDDQKVNMEQGSAFLVYLAHPLVCYPILRVNPAVILDI